MNARPSQSKRKASTESRRLWRLRAERRLEVAVLAVAEFIVVSAVG